MNNLHYFSSVKSGLKNLIKQENIILPNKFLQNFLRFISKACNYEEEGNKIRPLIWLGSNIDKAIVEVPNLSFIPMKTGKRDGSDLEKILKATIPFCNNGWAAYIDIKANCIEYGLLRAFSGPKGLTASQVLFMNSDRIEEYGYALIELSVISSYELCVKGLKQNTMVIDFRLINDKSKETKCNYNKMVEDITSNIFNSSEQESLKKVFNKLLAVVAQRVHGTICLVVKEDYKFPNEFLSDGIWLPRPINLSESALLTDKGNECEQYYGLSGLLLEMMNVDGITIIDSQGKIRGYNVFINQANVKEIKVGGGARKRAAYALLHTRDNNILGVYFQSQDGNAFYERMSDFEQ